MNGDEKKRDMKLLLVDELNLLTGIISNVKEARNQSNSALNYRGGSSKFSTVHHRRPVPTSYSTFAVSGNSSMQYKKSFSFHKNSVIGQKFVNTQSVQNNFEKTYQAHSYKLHNGNINTRYTKTNVNNTVRTSHTVGHVLPSSNTSSIMKIDNALSSKYAQPYNIKKTNTEDIGNSKLALPPFSNFKSSVVEEPKIAKCDDVQLLSRDVSPQSHDQHGSPLKTAPNDEETCQIVCEIIKTDDSNKDTCTVDPSSDEVKEIEVLYDSQIPDKYQNHKPEESSVPVPDSSLKDRTSEKINRISNTLSEISRRNTLKRSLSVNKLQRKSLSNTSQNCKQIWKSKYKVINRHVKSNLEKAKVKCVTPSGILKNTDPKRIVNNSHSLNKYRLVKNSGEDKSSVNCDNSKDKMLLNANRLLNLATNKKIVADGIVVSDSVKYNPYKSPSKKISNFIAPSSFASQISLSKTNSAAKLDMKLKELERETRSHYKGYDLSQISPMELVSLDHKSLLKIVANEKKPESFVKKSKYKLESKSTNEKQWNNLKSIPSVRSGTKLGTVRKPISQTDLSKTRVVMIRGMKYQVGSSGKCMKAVLKRNIATDKNISKTPLKRFCQKGIAALSTNTPQQARNVASRVLNRSIRSVRKASKRTSPKSDAYCIFFNRFGRCNTGDSCPYIHDPNKIAVCTRFLKGSCKRKGCPFSHEINPGKMAICSFYLRGACKKDNLCPYRHELLKPGTELCKAFVRGYCPNGSECEKAHILSCPDYMRGCCKKEDCQYPHPPRKVKRKIEDSFVSLKRAKSDSSKEEAEVKQVDNVQENDFRYFSHDPNTGEIKIFSDDNNDGTILPKRLSDITGLADFIPLKSKTQYRPEEFSDADCLE